MHFIKYLILIIITVVYGCTKIHEKQISIEEFNYLNTDTLQIVDVRTEEEFAEGHIPNAVNINWSDSTFLTQIKQYDTSSAIYVYCETDVRSNKAAIALTKLNYTNVINITGGFREYSRIQHPHN